MNPNRTGKIDATGQPLLFPETETETKGCDLYMGQRVFEDAPPDDPAISFDRRLDLVWHHSESLRIADWTMRHKREAKLSDTFRKELGRASPRTPEEMGYVLKVHKAVQRKATRVSRNSDRAAPHANSAIAGDRVKAQLAWIRRTRTLTHDEQTAAMLRTDGETLNSIATRLKYRHAKTHKPMTRQGVQQLLNRAAAKLNDPRMFRSVSYREHVRHSVDPFRPTVHY